MISEYEAWVLITEYGIRLQGACLAHGGGGKPEVQKVITRLGELVKFLPDVKS